MQPFWGPATLTKLRLSRPMRRCLLRLVRPGVTDHGGTMRVIDALWRRGLIDPQYRLTILGRGIAQQLAEREARRAGRGPDPEPPKPDELPGQLRMFD